jgi:hypothetical protein
MVHDDDTTPPEINDITTARMVRGTAGGPNPEIYDLIASVSGEHPEYGPGRIQEVLREDHRQQVPLTSVVYVLNELRKATERSGGSR